MKSTSPECKMTFWSTIIYNDIRINNIQTHVIVTLLDLVTEIDIYTNFK